MPSPTFSGFYVSNSLKVTTVTVVDAIDPFLLIAPQGTDPCVIEFDWDLSDRYLAKLKLNWKTGRYTGDACKRYFKSEVSELVLFSNVVSVNVNPPPQRAQGMVAFASAMMSSCGWSPSAFMMLNIPSIPSKGPA